MTPPNVFENPCENLRAYVMLLVVESCSPPSYPHLDSVALGKLLAPLPVTVAARIRDQVTAFVRCFRNVKFFGKKTTCTTMNRRLLRLESTLVAAEDSMWDSRSVKP
jgi:hypothetical protein